MRINMLYDLLQAHDKYRDLQCFTREVPDLEQLIHVEELHRNPNVYIVRNLFRDSELNRVKHGAQEEVIRNCFFTILILPFCNVFYHGYIRPCVVRNEKRDWHIHVRLCMHSPNVH